MIKRLLILSVMGIVVSAPVGSAQEVGQQFEGFNLQGYTDGGEKAWDVNGDTADIIGDTIEITNVDANRYGDQKMNVTAQKGTIDKATGNLLLERDVIITSEDGSQLKTDSLDWEKDKDLLKTEDYVTLTDNNRMVATGTGLEAKPGLKTAKMKKDVTIKFNTETDAAAPASVVTITCDGPMEIDQRNNRAILRKNVVAVQENRTLKADKLELYFDSETEQIKKMICTGNVRIIQGENSSFSQRAVYTGADQKIILSGQPKLVFIMEGNEQEQE